MRGRRSRPKTRFRMPWRRSPDPARAPTEPARPVGAERAAPARSPKGGPRADAPKRLSMTTRTVPGFLPSRSAFAFANDFPKVPVRHIGIPGVVSVPIGDASNGLCGGMAFAARDWFEADRPLPPDTQAPSSGPLFDYLVDGLFDSFNLPFGPARYLELMSPLLSDGETTWSRLGLAPRGRAWRMIRQEWPAIRAEIDAGHPCPLGLVRVKSSDPFELKRNHQVLAYGYDLDGTDLELRLYDPNRPKDDGVTLSLELSHPTTRTTVLSHPAGPTVFSFFRVPYEARVPPAAP